MAETQIVWTDYMIYRTKLRGFDLDKVEHILRYSTERYGDSATGRHIVVGSHEKSLVIIPYELEGNIMTPVTIHVTSRQQVNFRLKSGRFGNE